jgi:hypothetical protein
MLYFAYGSNMNPVQMKERCKDHPKVLGIAVLPDYELCFPRHSVGRNCGVASVVEKSGTTTWGVIYELTRRDAEALDADEGFKVDRDASLNSTYLTRIRQAARQHKLPSDHLALLDLLVH